MTPPLVAAALELQRCLQHAAIPACIIGGLAVQRWGEPRATQDVDITVLAPPGDEAGAMDVLLSAFTLRAGGARPRLPVANGAGRRPPHLRGREYGALFGELKDDPDLLRPFERALRLLR